MLGTTIVPNTINLEAKSLYKMLIYKQDRDKNVSEDLPSMLIQVM